MTHLTVNEKPSEGFLIARRGGMNPPAPAALPFSFMEAMK